MDHITIAYTTDTAGEARQLADRLAEHGRSVQLALEGNANLQRQMREARCTIVVWPTSSTGTTFLIEAAEQAIRHNVYIPLRSQEGLAENIPEAYRRVRPSILKGMPASCPLCTSDTATLNLHMACLWPVPSGDALPIHPSLARGSTRDSNDDRNPLAAFLPAVLWFATCLLIAILVDTAVRNYNPYAHAALRDDAIYASARRKSSHVVEWLVPQASGVALALSPPARLAFSGTRTILLHGYNVSAKQAPTYFNDLIGSLDQRSRKDTKIILDWASGVRGATAFGPLNYFWTLVDGFLLDIVGSEIEMYDYGRRNAEGKGSDALTQLLDIAFQENGGRKIDIIAHSMGCYLTLQALKKRPDLATRIGSLILLAPAVHNSVFEDPTFAATIAKIDRVEIYFSRKDSVLRIFGSFRHAAPMLGSVGPTAKTNLPQNTHLHDVTDTLSNRDVHGSYLRPDGIDALSIWINLSP